ncbi:MAG TPA: VC0807 family protein [Chloroflexota bacterium]|nr:VC0807 family protein [Chloroflexota bacterium]
MTPQASEPTTAPAASGPTGPGGGRHIPRQLIASIAINAVAPFLVYLAITRYTSLPEILALAATGLPPLLDALVGIVRQRRVDFMAGFVLGTIALSLALVALGGDPRLYLIRESLVTGGIALAFLGSLVFPKPLAYYFARYFMSANDPARMAWVDQLWETVPPFRTLIRVNSLVWGAGLLLEAALRAYLVYALPVPQFLAISPFVFWGAWGLLMLFSVAYGQHQRRAAQRQANRAPPSDAAAQAPTREPS